MLIGWSKCVHTASWYDCQYSHDFNCGWFCSYGQTANGQLVDSARLQLLENMGFNRALAAQALKQVLHAVKQPASPVNLHMS